MNTTVSKSFGLALLLAVGILAVMVAVGTFSAQKAAADVSDVSLEFAPIAPGGSPEITIKFTESVALATDNTITIVFDEGFVLAGTMSSTDINISGKSGGDATADPPEDPEDITDVNPSSIVETAADRKVVLTIPDVIAGGDNDGLNADAEITVVFVTGAGITLPAEQGGYGVTVSTTATTAPVASNDFHVSTITARDLEVSPGGAGDVSTINIDFTETVDLPVGDTITVKLDKFGVPSTIDASSVRLRGISTADGTAAVSANPDGVSVSGTTIAILVPDMTQADGTDGLDSAGPITVLFQQAAGITLPTAAGKYAATVKTSKTTTAVPTDEIEIVRTLKLSKSKGPRGTEVTATGKGFGSSGDVLLWLDNGKGGDEGDADNGARDGLEPVLARGLAVSAGSFSVNFTVDSRFGVGSDGNSLQARDASGAIIDDGMAGSGVGEEDDADKRPSFKVTGTVSLDKERVRINEKLKISLSDFPGGGKVAANSITIGSTPQTHPELTVNASGDDINKVSHTIEVSPNTSLGTQVVSVKVDDEDAAKANVIIAAVPMTVSPDTAVPGQEVSVSATGFHGGVKIKSIKVAARDVPRLSNGNPVPDLVTSSDGDIDVTFRIPTVDDSNNKVLGPGDHLVRIEDMDGRIGEATLTIPALTVTLSTDESRRNSTVTASGTGFVANDSILLDYKSEEQPLARPVGNARTDSVGAWTVQFKVPADANIGQDGKVTAKATTGGATKNADHKVPDAAITLEPKTAAAGSTVTITGSSFLAFASLGVLQIGDIDLPRVGIQTDEIGDFSAEVTVPQLAVGTHTVTVKVGQKTKTAQLVVPVDTTQAVEDVFKELIDNDSLTTVWRYDFDTRTWTSYTTDPETSFGNDLFEVESGDILYVHVSSDQSFSHQKGNTLMMGWSLITLK